VYGALRVRDGKGLTCCAASRNSKNYITFLADIATANPRGVLGKLYFRSISFCLEASFHCSRLPGTGGWSRAVSAHWGLRPFVASAAISRHCENRDYLFSWHWNKACAVILFSHLSSTPE
jgi:hypothetical protein